MSNSSVVTASVASSLTNIAFSAGTASNLLSSLVFSNANSISFGLSGSTVTASFSAAPSPVNFSAGGSSGNLGSVVFSNSNNISFGLSGSTITGTVSFSQSNQTFGEYAVGNTIGGQSTSSTFDARSQSIYGSGLASVGFSNSSLVIAVVQPFISSYENFFAPIAAATGGINGVSISHAAVFQVPNPITMSYLRIPVSMTTGSTTFGTTAQTANVSGALYSTWNAVIYSVGTGTNSTQLYSVTSGSNGYTFMNSMSVAVNGTQYSVTQAFSAHANGAGTTLTTQYSISNTNYSLTTNQIATQFSAGRFIDIEMIGSLLDGPYWAVIGYSSSSATNSAGGYSNMTGANVQYSNYFAGTMVNSIFRVMGSTNGTSAGLMLGAGSFSTAGGGTTANFPLSAISSLGNHSRMYFQILGIQ